MFYINTRGKSDIFTHAHVFSLYCNVCSLIAVGNILYTVPKILKHVT